MDNLNYKNKMDDWAPNSPGRLTIDNQKRHELKKESKKRSQAIGYAYKISTMQLYQQTDQKFP